MLSVLIEIDCYGIKAARVHVHSRCADVAFESPQHRGKSKKVNFPITNILYRVNSTNYLVGDNVLIFFKAQQPKEHINSDLQYIG